MLKRGLALLLALVMLTSVASAVQATTPEGERYDVSAWAQKDVAEAWKIGLHKSNTYTDYRKPVPRGLFGADASRLVALAFGLALAGCGSSASSSTAAGTYTAGTYSATATGINTATPVTVTMTFSADAITDVQIDVANETKGYGADIADEMVKKILDAQSSEVDGHSGATITSDAIRKAAESCINQAKGVAVAPTEASKAETVVPDGLTTEEVESSVVELGDITPDETKDFDVVVVGAGAAGVPAAGWAAELGGHVALLQKQNIVVSQGNCGSAIIKSKSTEAGKKMWVHMTNGLCDWRADTSLLNAYVENSEEALMWYLNRAGLTDQTEYGDGSLVDSNKDPSSLLHNDEKEIFAYMCTSQDLTGVWKDRMDTYDFGDEHCYFFAPWIGPKPKNVGDVLATVLENVQAKNSNLETFFNTPAVKLVHADGKVTGVIAKDESGKYIQFNASKGVILATGDYMNNEAMVKRWCPDVDGFDKKQYQKTGDGHIMAIDAGAKMENLGHTKMMHDFDSGLMYEEPFLYVNMEGKRFCNEDTGFVYMGNITKYLPRYNGANVDANHPDGSLGWYCQIYDSDYMSYANSPVPEQVMTKYIPGAVENPQGVFTNLIDTYKADTIEELAALLDVPADELQKTIDRYNELVTKGADDDFHKPADFLYPVVKAPFYAAKVGVALLAVVGGLSVNTDLQVLDDEKEPIEGLYATGNTSGDLYAIDYPINMAGNSNGRCVIWGYLLGKTMAKATASGEALTSRDELADLAKDENGIVASDTVYKDGSYTGTGKGRGGDMEVTVTITDGKISDIVVNSHAESSDIGAPALDKLIQNAIAANSAEIDGASGATMTSDGFREAVAQALAKAQ